MDERRFDELARRLGGSRRRFLTRAVGLAGVAAVGGLVTGDAEAARRGYSGPPLTTTGTITIEFMASSGGGCMPHGVLASFPRNTQTPATWYVMNGSATLGPYVSLAITDAGGFGTAEYNGPPITPGPSVSVRVEVSGVTASAPVRC